ncbi:hypothetical protein ECG_02618 [Echinococcus granulosus]|nr:hypothetical protein ECG_02618 [Echinococcus granulosus]
MQQIRVTALITLYVVVKCIDAAPPAKAIDYIYYSPWWWASRAKFGYPIQFTSLRIFYFDEWSNFKSNWLMAWDLVEGANYEVPKYLREKNYIPTNWKDHCAPGSNSMGDDYMLHDFSEDDSRQPESVLNLVSEYQSYWNGDWLKLFLFFYNLCYCLRGLRITSMYLQLV